MLSLKDLKRQQEHLFGYKVQESLLIDKPSLQRATDEIQASLKLAQTTRVQNSRKLQNLQLQSKQMVDLDKVFKTQDQLEYIAKLKRIQRINNQKRVFSEIFTQQLDDFKIEEGVKISMKEINEIFDTLGYELSKVQLNELFLEMEAGRKFNRQKFTKWIKANYKFVMKKDPEIGPNIKAIVEQQMKQDSLMQNQREKNNLSLDTKIVFNKNQQNQINSLDQGGRLDYFKKNRKTIDFTSGSTLLQEKKKLTMKQLERNLSNWSTNLLDISRNKNYDQDFINQDRQDRTLANKIIKYNNPIYQDIKEEQNNKLITSQRKKMRLQNKTIDYGSKTDKPDIITIKNQENKNEKPGIQLGGVLRGSFYNGSKINFFNKDKIILERIDENPIAQPPQISNNKQQKKNMNATQHIQRKQSDSYENTDTNNNNISFQIKQESSMFNQVKPRGTFYDTFNTTFYTQTDSFYDEEPQTLKNQKNKLQINEIMEVNLQKRNNSVQSKVYENDREDYNLLLNERMNLNKIKLKNQELKRLEVNNALDMIQSNKRAQSLLHHAIESMNKDQIDLNTERVKDYQEEVRRRLRDKKHYEESQQEHRVAYIASMLPSALDMHKFIKVMKKDKVFESDTGFKIVTKIKTHKDKERLEYLLNYKLSST
eukprot:403360960